MNSNTDKKFPARIFIILHNRKVCITVFKWQLLLVTPVLMAAPMLTQMKKESSTHLDLHCEKVDPDMNPNHLLARLVAATTVKQQLIL